MRTLTVMALLCSCGVAGSLEPSVGPVQLERPTVSPTPNPFAPLAGPCLDAPSRVLAPETMAGCAPARVDVVIANRCDFEVRLSSSRAEAVGFSQLPHVLGPGASATATVRVLPSVVGPVHERLTLTALADGFSQDTALLVEGAVVPARRVAWEQVVPRRPPVELLLIIDDDEVFEADANFALLARSLAVPGDVRVVVSDLTGTISRPDGVSVLDTEDSAFIDHFMRATRVTRTPGVRSCHETARRLMARREPAGFWNDGPRAVICVTNELDQSDVPGSAMLGQWQERMGMPMTSFSVVAPYSEQCGALDSRLDLVREFTNGVREDLCSRHWSNALESYSRSAFGFRLWFHLPSTPTRHSTQSLQVSVDGTPLPQLVGTARSWEFDGATNAIVFQPPSAPSPGATLRVSWETCDAP